MFVSAYNTYIQPNTSDKNIKSRFDKQNSSSASFKSKLFENSPPVDLKNSSLPVDYISKSKAFNNKLEIETQKEKLAANQEKPFNDTKRTIGRFIDQSSILNAKNAYETNSKMFSLIPKPHHPLDFTPKVDTNLPQKAQETKENHLRNKMVNTYMENEIYYKITA